MRRTKRKTRKYTALFEANEEGGYAVTVPALPELVTEGKGVGHARRTAKDAIVRYIVGSRKRKSLSRLNVKRHSSGFLSSRRRRPKNPARAKGARIGHPQIQRPGHPSAPLRKTDRQLPQRQSRLEVFSQVSVARPEFRITICNPFLMFCDDKLVSRFNKITRGARQCDCLYEIS